jgi:hypothetical protein
MPFRTDVYNSFFCGFPELLGSLSISLHLLDKIPGGSFKKVSYLEVIYSFAEEKDNGKDKRDTSINGIFI